ncbi:hypothetical protein KR044_005481 [Drosophila immigrans]|nr:hypothetical protein KR044_005481 [Drosophila immigrans]
MNQFHTPSFGDEVFEMNDSPIEPSPTPTPNPNASRRISRLSSLDHVDVADEQQMDYEITGPAISTQEQQQQLLPPQQQQQQQQQQPAKPLAPFALFFRDTMTTIKQQNPACTLEQITAIVHNMWDSMDDDEKTVYDRRHEMDKRDYMLKLRDYQRQQQQQQEQQLLEEPPSANVTEEQQQETPTATVAVAEEVAAPATAPAPPPVQLPQQPEQIQLVNEAAAVPKCTREFCNKPAIINPDWEDEYCSNECVVIHCRNEFNEWVRALQYSPP